MRQGKRKEHEKSKERVLSFCVKAKEKNMERNKERVLSFVLRQKEKKVKSIIKN